MLCNKLFGTIRAQITGFDIREVNQKTAQQIYQSFLEYLMIVLRNQDLAPDQRIRASENCGEVEVNLAKDYLHPDPVGTALYVSLRFTDGI